MSLAQIPGRSASETGDERVRGDRALADEIERTPLIVTIEGVVNNSETAIPHGQPRTPTVVGILALGLVGFGYETRPADDRFVYLLSNFTRTYRITLLVPRR